GGTGAAGREVQRGCVGGAGGGARPALPKAEPFGRAGEPRPGDAQRFAARRVVLAERRSELLEIDRSARIVEIDRARRLLHGRLPLELPAAGEQRARGLVDALQELAGFAPRGPGERVAAHQGRQGSEGAQL